jgi:heme-degrading monooxygenase HmoA
MTSTYRIDKFIVPEAAMAEFMPRVHHVDRLLGQLPGCRQSRVLTQTGGTGVFNVVTIVEWDSEEAIRNARSTMQAHYEREGFDTEAFMRRLGVQADLALYAETTA